VSFYLQLSFTGSSSPNCQHPNYPNQTRCIARTYLNDNSSVIRSLLSAIIISRISVRIYSYTGNKELFYLTTTTLPSAILNNLKYLTLIAITKYLGRTFVLFESYNSITTKVVWYNIYKYSTLTKTSITTTTSSLEYLR